MLRPVALGLVLLAALGNCHRIGLPDVAMPGQGDAGMRRLVENRAWIETDPAAPKGTLRAFMTDGTLVMTSCGETYRLAAWRWVDGMRLVWDEDGAILNAEVLVAEYNSLVLAIKVGDETETHKYRHAAPPEVCPDLRG